MVFDRCDTETLKNCTLANQKIRDLATPKLLETIKLPRRRPCWWLSPSIFDTFRTERYIKKMVVDIHHARPFQNPDLGRRLARYNSTRFDDWVARALFEEIDGNVSVRFQGPNPQTMTYSKANFISHIRGDRKSPYSPELEDEYKTRDEFPHKMIERAL